MEDERRASVSSFDGEHWPRTWTQTADFVSGTAHSPHIAETFVHLAARVATVATSQRQAEDKAGDDVDELREALLFEYEGAASTPHAVTERTPGVVRQLSVRRRAPGELEEGTCNVLVQVEEGDTLSSTWQAGLNAANVLCGVGLLTTPFAVGVAGIASLGLLALVAGIACYTATLLGRCQELDPSIRSFPDIGRRAFGTPGRVLVSVLLYTELLCCCVDFVVLEGDNLAALFPHAALRVGGLQLSAKQTMMLAAAVVILPTVLLRNLRLLSYVSVGGVFASGALIALVGWAGASQVGFTHTQPPAVTWQGVPMAIGVYCFCFSGHAVLPSLYTSIRHKSQWPTLLATTFALVAAMYALMALLGALMFGSSATDNITMDLQRAAPGAPPTLLATWLVVINPLTKVGLTLAPVALAMEELLPMQPRGAAFAAASAAIRAGLLALVLLVALFVPFFGLLMSFIGAFMSMSISIVLPALFWLSICWRPSMGAASAAVALGVAVFGCAAGGLATYHAVASIIGAY